MNEKEGNEVQSSQEKLVIIQILVVISYNPN